MGQYHLFQKHFDTFLTSLTAINPDAKIAYKKARSAKTVASEFVKKNYLTLECRSLGEVFICADTWNPDTQIVSATGRQQQSANRSALSPEI